MRSFNHWLFGMVMPTVEVLLVIAGLGLLGWEGTIYTWTGHWTTWRIVALTGPVALPGIAGALLAWALHLPIAGACLVTGVGLFFLLPPAYAHA